MTLQEDCPGNITEHIGLATSGVVFSGIRQALNRQPIKLDCSAL